MRSFSTTHIEVDEVHRLNLQHWFWCHTPDYTFFMDEGIVADGTQTKGEHGRAVVRLCRSALRALGTIASLNNGTAPDFMLFQKWIETLDRSYHVNQVQETGIKFLKIFLFRAEFFIPVFLRTRFLNFTEVWTQVS